MSIRRVLGSAVCVLLVPTGLAAGAGAQTEPTTATRPATGGNGVPVIFGHTSFDLASVGYTQAEFVVEGTAAAYAPAAPLTSDGRWTVEPTAPADFTTRIVVNRPTRPRATSTAPSSSSGSTSAGASTPAPTGSTCTTS